MKICGLEKLSLVDYESKMAAVVFLEGCNFACPFCHNSSLTLHDDSNVEIPQSEVIKFLEKRVNLLDAVCVSGGEPTLDPKLTQLLEKIKSMGFLVKLDTNGTHPEVLRALNERNLIDYVAMDIKNSQSKYSITSGTKVKFSNIRESVDYIISSISDYEFRTTLISQYHTEADIKDISLLISGAKKYFLQKFKLVDACFDDTLTSVSEETALSFKKLAETTVKTVKLRGY